KSVYDKQLRESEEKYRSVVTAMNEGVIMRDRYGKIITWNKAAERIFGITAEEISRADSKKPAGRLIQEDGSDFPDDAHPAFVTLRTGKAQHNVIMGIQKSPEQIRWVSVNSEPIFADGKNLPEAVVTSFSDITEQKNTERELRQLNATKDKLFSIIAHDLKSPFNAQLGFLELLLDEDANYGSVQRRQFMNMVYDSAKQSFALLDNLLLWSRSQTGKMPFNPVDINITQAIEGVIDMHRATLEIKNIRIGKSFECSNDLKVMADHDMLDTVLRNLISNAIKFSHEGGEVNVLLRQNSNGQITIAVRDYGIGIPDENLKKLFNADQSVSTIGTKNEKGTGLGLIICKEFVERNGGEIWVESSKGQGSTFYFTMNNADVKRSCELNCLREFDLIMQQLKHSPQLSEAFEKMLIPRFKIAYKSFSDDELTDFGDILYGMSQKHDVIQFATFSRILNYSLQKEDYNQINICFAEFEKLADEFEAFRLRR
ncbi:MAG: ATP-binding protein, partial [Bacteroidales bacterium]